MRIPCVCEKTLAVVSLVWFAACGTDATGPDTTALRGGALSGEAPGQFCQVVRNLGQDGFLQNYRYDSHGFLVRWDDGFGSYLPQYDANGKLVRARYVLGDITLASISYDYSGDKIAKEVWLNGATGLVDDILVNTWDAKGQLTKRASVPFGVYTAFTYDALGNAYQVDVLSGTGALLLSNTYTFLSAVKSPDVTLRGLPYGAQFLNYVFNPRRQTSAKAVISDIDGNLVTLFDQDPGKSVLVGGQQQLALYQNLYDKVSATFYGQTWSYNGCAGNNFPPDIGSPTSFSVRRAGVDFALRGSTRTIKQQIAALARRYGR